MQLPPLEVMATWPTPNYVDPVTRGNGLVIVNIVFGVLSFVIVVLRIYARLAITSSFGMDDVLIVIAMMFSIAMMAVTSLAAAQYGWDRHVWDVPITWLPSTNKLNMTFQVTFSWASSLTKLSLLWFCRRLLGAGKRGPFKRYDWAIIAAMVIVAALCISFTFATIFQCTPVKAFWDIDPTYHYHCLDGESDTFAASVVNVFTDFLTTLVPMPLIWSVKLPTRQRIAVMSIFGLGILVNVAGSFRTVYVYKAMIASYDQTWMGWPISLAAAIEIGLSLIVASAPGLRPLVAHYLPRLLPNSRSAYGSASARATGGRDPKPWTSALSKNSAVVNSTTDPASSRSAVPSERMEIVRTVDMQTYYENGDAHSVKSGPSPPQSITSISTRAPGERLEQSRSHDNEFELQTPLRRGDADFSSRREMWEQYDSNLRPHVK